MKRFGWCFMVLLLTGCNSLVEPHWPRIPSYALPVDSQTPLATLAQKPQTPHSTKTLTPLKPMKNTPHLDELPLQNEVPTHDNISGIVPLSSGLDAFAVRNALIKNAKTSLDLQYYILHKGLSSRLLIREMVLAANRGVHIRILIDDMDILGRDKEMTTLSAHHNIEVRVFNPIRAFRGSAVSRSLMLVSNLKTQHRRMHNKQWIADGVLGVLGGRNIGDQYFNASEHDNFADLDVLLSGPVVKEMVSSFDEYWNSPQTFPISVFEKEPNIGKEKIHKMLLKTNDFTLKERVARHPYLKALDEAENEILPRVLSQRSWAPITFLADAPDKVSQTPPHSDIVLPVGDASPNTGSVPLNGLLPYLKSAKKEVLIVSPYFLPGDDLSNLLTNLVKKGVRVAILTNSLESNDVPMINAPYQKYRLRLLKAGVEIYELRGTPDVDPAPKWRLPIFTWKGSRAALHAKAIVIDGHTSFVGSINLDGRSIVWNTEVAIITHQTSFAHEMQQLFLSATENLYSYHVTLNAKNQLNWSTPKANKPALTQEPGNLWRKLQRSVGKLVPETYL